MFVKVQNLNVNAMEWHGSLYLSQKVQNNILCVAVCNQFNACGMVALESGNQCRYYNSSLQQRPFSSLYDSPNTLLYHKGIIPKSVYESISYLTRYLTHNWPLNNSTNDVVGGYNFYGGSSTGKSFTTDRFGYSNSAVYLQNSYFNLKGGVYFAGDYTVSLWVKVHSTTSWPGRIFHFSLSGY